MSVTPGWRRSYEKRPPLATPRPPRSASLAQRKRANLVPIVGARTSAQLADNLAALEVELPAERLASLDEASAIKLGFPGSFLADNEVVQLIFGTTRGLIAN